MVQKIQGAQRDFSSGEIDVALKRSDDHPVRKTGLRQMANARILNSGSVQNRPGRRALYPVTDGVRRIERFTISAGNVFDIHFAGGRVKIINSAGVTVANFTTQGNGAALPWATTTDVNAIVYALLGLSIYITFAGMRPQVISWDDAATWSIADYVEMVTGNQKRTLFYEISPRGIALLPSAQTGNITISASAPLFSAAWVGTRIRFVDRQILITGYTDNVHVNATVEETLPGGQGINFAPNDPALVYNVGDEVIGSVSGSKGIITSIAGNNIFMQLLSTQTSTIGATGGLPSSGTGTTTTLAFVVADYVGGPGGTLGTTSVTAVGPPKAVALWDEEVFNSLRGYPASVFVDQFRLGFCDFPSVPGGIAWSAINSPTDLYVGANPSGAMFEIAPAKVRVQHVVPGPESSEFVFCDSRIYYIPISPTNPLKPGSVAFQLLSGDGAARVQPRIAQEAILYVNAGQNSVMAIVASGAYLRPFNTKNLSDFHGHLFNNISAIAAPSADGTFNERYVYVVNNVESGAGTLVVGKYNPESLLTNTPVIGWGPWSVPGGTILWVSAHRSDVLFNSSYVGSSVCEVLDDSQYLDCAIAVNAAPAAFAPPGGKGPLWFVPSQTVALIDQSTRFMGAYQVDANGFLIAQNSGGEDLTVTSLVAGFPWSMIVEPFCPDAAPGTDVGQRMFKRRISRFAVYVVNSTGFLMARLFSGPITPTSPPLGTVMNQYRVPAWNMGDDATKPPPQREEAQRWRPIGRAFDPRVAIIKDSPGPLLIAEIGIEATI